MKELGFFAKTAKTWADWDLLSSNPSAPLLSPLKQSGTFFKPTRLFCSHTPCDLHTPLPARPPLADGPLQTLFSLSLHSGCFLCSGKFLLKTSVCSACRPLWSLSLAVSVCVCTCVHTLTHGCCQSDSKISSQAFSSSGPKTLPAKASSGLGYFFPEAS